MATHPSVSEEQWLCSFPNRLVLGHGDHERRPNDLATLAAAEYDVDVRSGFLPPQEPIRRLAGPQVRWEEALDAACLIPLKLGGGGDETARKAARKWRRCIREMPVLWPSADIMADVRKSRRANLVLSHLAHFYMHSQPAPGSACPQTPRSWCGYLVGNTSDTQDSQDAADELAGKYCSTVPASLAVPWVALSDLLGLPPILTYSTTVLCNWALPDATLPLGPSNLAIAQSFSGTDSEAHFYRVSIQVESRGVEALSLICDALDEACRCDEMSRRRIAGCLVNLARVIEDLTKLLHSMYGGCEKEEFFWIIRNWFTGSDSAPDGTGGWHYEGVDPPGVRRTYNGPSAGQSSLIHAIDIFLDIDHTHSKARPKLGAGVAAATAAALVQQKPTDSTFMERMRTYIPKEHRAFLEHLRSVRLPDTLQPTSHYCGPIRTLALQQTHATDPTSNEQEQQETDDNHDDLAHSYDAALLALQRFRDEHMRIVTYYVVQPARDKDPPERLAEMLAHSGRAGGVGAVWRVSGSDGVLGEGKHGAPKGTSGTDLVRFLKDCRDSVVRAMVRSSGGAEV